MVIFLYTGFIIAIAVIFILFSKQTKKIKVIKSKNKNINRILLRVAIIDLSIGIFIIVFISYLLPLTIWLLGKKDVVPTEMVTIEKSLVPIEGKTYVKEKVAGENGVYVINLGDKDNKEEKIISKDSVTIEEISKALSPKYREVSVYEFKRLISNNFISRNVNDMFANIYMENSEGTFLEKKIIISLPKDSKIDKE